MTRVREDMKEMLNKLTRSVAAIVVAMSAGTGVAAASEGGHVVDYAFSFEGPFGSFDKEQLQRGLKVYTEVCSACHGLRYVAFRDLEELGYSKDQVAAYAASHDVYDPEIDDTRPGKPTDHFPHVTSAGAPDLSMMAKARAGFHGPYSLGINQFFKGIGGPEYIASILTEFTGKEKEQAGSTFYENAAFPSGWLRMPPPLSDGQVEFDDGSPNDLHSEAKDVAAFLMWTAEPKQDHRKAVGVMAIILLVLLSSLLYLTNKRLWAPVKGKEVA